jgi:hypothetical protein
MQAIPRTEFRDRLRRKLIRYKFRVDAEICRRSTSRPCRVTDISRDGMYIEVANPPREGSSFAVRLALNVPLRLNCVVRRVVGGVGVGVSFSVKARDRKRFDGLLMALGADKPVDAGMPFSSSPQSWTPTAVPEQSLSSGA